MEMTRDKMTQSLVDTMAENKVTAISIALEEAGFIKSDTPIDNVKVYSLQLENGYIMTASVDLNNGTIETSLLGHKEYDSNARAFSNVFFPMWYNYGMDADIQKRAAAVEKASQNENN